ncbi:MAG: lipoate--protein ligase family protein [Actinobacteria bacterium]|nr:lipoate--protein ligase family protein [Actinomycetota bacterium]
MDHHCRRSCTRGVEAVSAHRLVTSAGELHARPISTAAAVEVLRIDRSAVVLGSTQSFDLVDAERAAELGFDVVRRRSGGGVVILQQYDHLWVDVTVPRGHRLWHDDVERATWWLGEVWCDALTETIGAGVWAVHRDRLTSRGTERSVCFAALGPGEVTRDTRKVVGIAQRRTKDAARFQCTVFRAIDVALYQRLLRIEVAASLGEAVGVGEKLKDVSRAVVERLTEAIG